MSPIDALTSILRRRTTVSRRSTSRTPPFIVPSRFARPTVGMCSVLSINGRDILVEFKRLLPCTLPLAPEGCPEVTYLWTNSPASISICPGTCFTLFAFEEHFVVQIIEILAEDFDPRTFNAGGRADLMDLRIPTVFSRATVVDRNNTSSVEALPDTETNRGSLPPPHIPPRSSRRASVEDQCTTRYPIERSLPDLPLSSSTPSITESDTGSMSNEGSTPGASSEARESTATDTSFSTSSPRSHPGPLRPRSLTHRLPAFEELSPLTVTHQLPPTPHPQISSLSHPETRVTQDPPPPFSSMPGLTELLTLLPLPTLPHQLPPTKGPSPPIVEPQSPSAASPPKHRSSTRINLKDLKNAPKTPAAPGTEPTVDRRPSLRTRPGWDDTPRITLSLASGPSNAPVELKAPDYTSHPSVLFSNSAPQKKDRSRDSQELQEQRTERRKPKAADESTTTVTRTPIFRITPLQSPSRTPIPLHRGASLNAGLQKCCCGRPYDANPKPQTAVETQGQKAYQKLTSVATPFAPGLSTLQASAPKLGARMSKGVYDTPKSIYKNPLPPPRPPTASPADVSGSRR